MSKTKADLATSVLEELFVVVGAEPPEHDDQALVLRKIEEIMPEVERRGHVIGWRTDEIDEIVMDPLAKLVAARVCRKFVTEGELPSYEALEPRAWRMLARVKSQPYQARPTRASHV